MRRNSLRNGVSHVLVFIVAIASWAHMVVVQASVTEYSVDSDEFGDGEVHQLRIATEDTSLAMLFLSCFSGEELQLQLHADRTIFPDALDGKHMRLEVTHKVDTAPDATTETWQMNTMEYNNAWLQSGVRTLVQEMLDGERLSIRLDGRGTIYRFDLVEAQQHIPEVLSACSPN